MIYKTLKKVSDYCQLVDKRKFPATQTVYGVTFTNNGDGSITVDGTSTNQYYSSINLEIEIDKLVPGHTYIFTVSTSNIASLLLFEYPGSYILKSNNNIFVLPEYEYTRVYISIRVGGGNTASNATAKPQLFDLTEMYGAGNEPTTVEEFRTKFPNELYDYKPYCFVKSYKTLLKATNDKIITSYKKSLICTTKNLFDSEDWYNTLHAVNSTSMTKETVNGIEYYKFRPGGIWDYEYMKGEFKENTAYTLSFLGMNEDGSNTIYTGFIFGYTDGTNTVVRIKGEEQRYTLTSSLNKTIDYIKLEFYISKFALVRNIQLEEGSTATEYHPYGHL